MPDYSALLNAHVAGLSNAYDAGFPGARIEWTLHETHGNVPSVILRVRTHATTTIGVPYQLGKTSTYPFGVTSVPATTAGLTNICVPVATTSGAGYVDVIVAGFVPDAVTDGNVSANNLLEVIINGVAFIPDGGTPPVTTVTSCGLALETDTGTAADIWLFGTPMTIAGS
jgi:hypothetical protein